MQLENLRNNSIGVFDSGLGGLSVLKEIKKLLPNESIIYFSDSLNCPYGNRKESEIKLLSKKIVDFLVKKKKCKMMVIACNTITTLIIADFRKNYSVPFIGIEPAIKTAINLSKTKNIGVLATERTLESQSFQKLKLKISKDTNLFTKVGLGLVEIVENGEIYSLKTRKILQDYLSFFSENEVDQLVLGCTHYPFLTEIICSIDDKINLIDPASAVAKQVKNQLEINNLFSSKENGKCDFYTSGNQDVFKTALKLVNWKWNESFLNVKL